MDIVFAFIGDLFSKSGALCSPWTKSSLTLLLRQQCLGSTGLILVVHPDLSMCWLGTCLNTREKPMEMTTPVFTRKSKSDGVKMDMTTPVITRKVEDRDTWTMSFVMPSKYGADLPLPKDSSVTIKEVPKRIIAVVAFPGFVTDEEVARRESTLRDLINNDPEFRVKGGAFVEVAQYNPPFTLPFNRRNEIALEVERKQA